MNFNHIAVFGDQQL